ncbi:MULTISPECIES: universal stress protein [unclassified Kribbella]|uniref:universal stress protein n=1 Tax=unclassified Kribbella TaxID=2644121 RepID=UPI0033C4B278
MSAQSPVLVGIDGSQDGLLALTWAARFATLHHAPLHAVYVLDDDHDLPAVAPLPGPDDGTEVLIDAARELERIGFRDASLEVCHGHPAKVLPEQAGHARALVVARRGLGGFAELVLGSTSQVCTAPNTDVPLIVVPAMWDATAPPHRRIVVGVDGSLEGQDAVRFAFELADATDAEVRGVHAAEFPADVGGRPWAAVADQLLTRSLDGWRTKYPGVVVDQRGVAEHPVRALAQESERADLVVVGGLGETSFSELGMGPVSRGVLYHSRCPIAVVHHP